MQPNIHTHKTKINLSKRKWHLSSIWFPSPPCSHSTLQAAIPAEHQPILLHFPAFFPAFLASISFMFYMEHRKSLSWFPSFHSKQCVLQPVGRLILQWHRACHFWVRLPDIPRVKSTLFSTWPAKPDNAQLPSPHLELCSSHSWISRLKPTSGAFLLLLLPTPCLHMVA